ncbi:phosphopantetheine-binding protein [Actinophytocola sp.]|uniref:phosphopantetheine-binding protein n=1 Tax=Actinophytocola sp. TaxID=1872138 RepID=UPI00389AF5A5
MLTSDVVRADVASLLHVLPEESDNLFEFGLDSVRVVMLVERWREAGAEVSFVQLAEAPTLGEWLRILVPVVMPQVPPLTSAA